MTVLPTRRTAATAVAAAVAVTGFLAVPALAPSAGASPGALPSRSAPPAAAGTISEDLVGDLRIENSFVSDQGWVKPGDSYPSRILLTNDGGTASDGAVVTITAPRGTSFDAARGPGTETVSADEVVWTPGAVAPGATATLILESTADTLTEEPTLVWRDLSTTAVLEVGADDVSVFSHGPKVIPPGETYETAKYGDRPFPVVPVQYRDRAYEAHDRDLDTVINSPAYEGSTFNLFQEMSLGQLYPEGTVPSDGLTTAPMTDIDQADFSQREVPGNTCVSTRTPAAPAIGTVGGVDYSERITDGVYNLPGDTGYYGSDANGSALIGAVAGVGALQQIDAGCGAPGKLVHDAAVLADPEVDYSDFDTDKDGVVDFFMAVFAGCGGNGSSQGLGADASCGAPYDNVWPHSSSLEFYFTDERTGLPGLATKDQLKNLEGQPLWYTDASYSEMTTDEKGDALKVFVRIGPYNVNPETAIDKASVISHEYGHSLGLPDFYSTGSRETYGDWNLMATDKSQNMDVFSRQELGWIVPDVLEPGTSPSVEGWTDSKQDTDAITWETPSGDSYTLEEGTDGRVQNAQAYVAKLPGRQLLDPAKFDTGDKASKTHAWWSGSGNDFGCAPTGGHNLDLSIPGLADLPPGSSVKLALKSLWDIEWDFDYGFVLTTTDGGETYTSHASENGYTTSNTDPLAGNPNQNQCQATYDNGLTGSSGSYQAGSEVTDRKLGTVPESVFLADSFDISDLAGAENGALRFSYATDPGLARPGWFIDDVTVTATTPGGQQVVLDTDFESSGGPDDERVFNGGCREDLQTAQRCTLGWNYVAAGAEAPADHAYYLEMRDRSGFDLDGKGQIDRDPIGFQAGLSLVYTDEAHGYGNAGTDDPPAQSPLDSVPEPGSATPDLDDAAFTAADGRSTFSDSGAGHTDNYEDPSSADGQWHFRYGCLGFDVTSMTGNADGPAISDGDLTGDVDFTMGTGCADFDYGDDPVPPRDRTAPTARMGVAPASPISGQLFTLSAAGSSDDTTAPGDLTYEWNFGNGGKSVDATGATVRTRFRSTGPRLVRLTVTDEAGNRRTVSRTVVVRRLVQCASDQVTLRGNWRSVRSTRANGGRYCDNLGRGNATDVATFGFTGPSVSVIRGVSTRGGTAAVHIDGRRVSGISFRSSSSTVRFSSKAYRGLGQGRHTIRIVVQRGQGYLDAFVVER